MNPTEIKQLLDEKYLEYCKSDFFVETDPIQIPKLFEDKEDIEIAGFLAASLAWGAASHYHQKMQGTDATHGLCPGKFYSRSIGKRP